MRDLEHPLGHIGLVLLAAGGSRRLGSPKQLLRDSHGVSLVRRAAETALGSACRPVAAVLGAASESICAELAGLPLTVVINPEWQTGLASSLKAGLDAVLLEGPLDAVIVMLCDQPKVSGALLDSLIAAYRDNAPQIAACEYGGALGVPALFAPALFGALASLSGDEGARRVIRDCPGPVTRIPFPEGLLDIDTPQDTKNLAAV